METEVLFQDILKRERILRGWSQANVAAKIGSDPKTVGRWERGLTSPSPYLTQQLCVLYGKTVQELSSASSQTLVEQQPKAAEPVVPSLPHRIPRKRLLIFLSALLVCTLLVGSSGLVLLHRIFPPRSAHSAPSSPPPYAGQGGVVALNDSLTANTTASWSLSNNDEGQCFFADGAYRIRGIKTGGYMKLCLAAETYFNNFTYEVKMQVVMGDCGGLALRATFPLLYYFVICQDGNYRFVRYDRDQRTNRRILVAGVSSAIHRGLNSTNTLAVVANGDTFTLYSNHLLLYRGTDGAYFDGQIGLLVHTCSIVYLDPRPDVCAVPVEVAFHDAKVWKG